LNLTGPVMKAQQRMMLFVFAVVMLVVCAVLTVFCDGHRSNTEARDSSSSSSDATSLATVNALNAWWKELTYAPPPVKAGTIIPAHTLTFKGRVRNVPQHVETKKEYEDEVEGSRYMDHMRSLVVGFSVTGPTVTIMTNLARDLPADIKDARELCHDLGGFVWANGNRHFGLQDIRVTGAHGDLLSSRIGLGKVQ